MKKTISIFCLAACACGASTLPGGNINGHVSLTWCYGSNQIADVDRFYLYSTTSLTLPTSQWTALTNIAATNFAPYKVDFKGSNWVVTNLSVTLDIQPSHYFFVATASNIWGETAIYSSNATSVPFPAQPINDSLKIQKVP